MIALSARMVRSYKGAAASILLLLMAELRPLTQGEMRRGTGYGDEAINDAVWMLREDGWLVEVGRYTWALSGGERQLPLGSSEPEPPAPTDPELMIHESMNQSDSNQVKDDSLIDDAASSDLSGATAADLQALGFYGRGLADLLAIPGLTLAEARYQVEHSPSLGAALSRLKRRQPLPEKAKARDAPSDRRRYIEGEFSEFIEH